MSIARNRAGVSSTPAFIAAYLTFISLDLYTTWLASPNLSLEGNKLIRLFDLDWPVIVTATYVFGITISILLVYASRHLKKYYPDSSINKITLKDLIITKQYVIPFIITSIFFSHLLISVFVTINNILSYIYIHNIENQITFLSIKYLQFKSLFSPYFYLYSYALLCCFSIFFSYLKVKKAFTQKLLP